MQVEKVSGQSFVSIGNPKSMRICKYYIYINLNPRHSQHIGQLKITWKSKANHESMKVVSWDAAHTNLVAVHSTNRFSEKSVSRYEIEWIVWHNEAGQVFGLV